MSLYQKVLSWVTPMRFAMPERRWRRLAHNVTRDTFLAWLGDQIAKDLIANKPHSVSIEELCVALRQTPANGLQYQAERFLEKYYYNYPFEADECSATVAQFRQEITQNLLRRCQE